MFTFRTCHVLRWAYCRGAIARLVALAALAASIAPAAESEKPSRGEQRTILRQLKSAKEKTRRAGLDKLDQFQTPTAAKLLVEQGLTSGFPDVRLGAYQALVKRRDSQPVCDLLLQRIKNAFKKHAADETTLGVLGVLLASSLEPVAKTTSELLEAESQHPDQGRGLLVSLADALGDVGDDTSIGTLLKLSKRPFFERVFAFRRAVVQALSRSDRPAAIDALIDILARAEGEIRADIARHLTALSGEEFALDTNAWREWWKENRATFTSLASRRSAALRPGALPIADALPPGYRSLSLAAPAHYYGMPLYAQRIMFVIDTSSSMSGLRIEAAKRELIKAIAALPEGVYFNVVVFSSAVAVWHDKLTVASPDNKLEAAAFVTALVALGNTCTYDALEAAFDFDVESIYFLTDGEPSSGKIVVPAQIVVALTAMNRSRRVTINSIGVGVGPIGSVFEVFLASLSSQNFGEYRRVDQ